MTCRATTSAVLVLAAAAYLTGCEDTATKHVRVQPPAPTPAPAAALASNYTREPLPVSSQHADAVLTAYYPRPAIDILVDQVQASFNAGRAAAQAGKAEVAQTNFDHAVDLILKSGFQKDSDPRLARLFDQIGDAVPSEVLDTSAENAANQTDEESETPAQPAPIDEIADLTLPAGDPRLAVRAEQELMTVPHDVPLTVNESVLQYLSFFTTTRGRAIVTRGLNRAGRYSGMIRRVLREEGVPQDLIYLAQAESAFQPNAVSRAGARGIWQFMPFRGEEYDLERTYYIDDRSDPEKATRAAARHLRDLYGMFGDWYLVMAAYNSGPLTVAKAVQRTGYADFWELQKRRVLPKQTQNYVPIILALALVAKAPSLYGVQVDAEKAPQVEAIKLDRPIDLRLVADAVKADVEDLHELNPQLLRNITPSLPGFQLKVPVGAARTFAENIQQVPEDKWTTWRLHSTEAGETLAEIAKRYRVTVPAIEEANHLEPHAVLPQGFLLNVPTAPRPAIHLVRYRVQRGDTLAAIADRFDVTVAQLKRWNRISGNRAPQGARLRIYAGSGDSALAAPVKPKSAQNAHGQYGVRTVSSPSSSKASALEYHVKAGETLYSIARQNQTTVDAIREANTFLAERPLQAGDVLKIQR